jgi:FKBP-type peptidyl-prolyl cis-trans isomerase FklB
MRIILSILFSAFLLAGPSLAEEKKETVKDAKDERIKLSYSLGYNSGNNFRKSHVDFDLEIFMKAFKEGFNGEKASLTDQEMREVLLTFRKNIAAMQAERKKEAVEKHRPAAEKNKQGDDVLHKEPDVSKQQEQK